jgi:hypothetical protein
MSRAISSALSEATGLAIERLSVSSETHPVAGTMLNVKIDCFEREWSVLEGRAREAMKAYSLAYNLARKDVPDLQGEERAYG